MKYLFILILGVCLAIFLPGCLPISLSGNECEAKTIAIMLTSNSKIPDIPNETTGYWGEEFIIPYKIFKDKGYEITVFSPKGGESPIDPRSLTDGVKSFLKEPPIKTLPIKEWLGIEKQKPYDAVFVVGGHGLIWDLADIRTEAGQDALKLLRKHLDKPIAAVCHGPSILVNLTYKDMKEYDPKNYFIYGKEVTGFSASEENGAEANIPGIKKAIEHSFLKGSLENALNKTSGNKYTQKADWTSNVVVSGNLITGQNPQSSEAIAKTLVRMLDFNDEKKDIENFVENIKAALNDGKMNGTTTFDPSRLILKKEDGQLIKTGNIYNILNIETNWKEGYSTFFVGIRNKEVKDDNFLSELALHVKDVAKAFGNNGLTGYVVLGSKDYEIALMNWSSKEGSDKCFDSDEGKKMVAQANILMKGILWTDAHKIPDNYLEQIEKTLFSM